MGIDHHRGMDEHPPSVTLFLHKDILACTLAYKWELQNWRIAELDAGCGDLSKPSYEEVSGSFHSSTSCLTYTSGIW